MIHRRPWLERTAWLFGIGALLFFVSWIAVPPLLKWQTEKQATAALGRDVRVGEVHFVPWKLDLTFDDVRIAPAPLSRTSASMAAPPMPPLLAIGRLHIDFAAASLWKLAPVIQALDIDALHLSVTRTAPGRYDIDDLIQRFSRQPASVPSDPAHFALYNLQLRDATIRFDDRSAKQVHELQSLHLAVPFLSNLPAEVDIKVEPRLSFSLNGVPFDSGAMATPFATTRSGELTLKFSGLELAPYLGYLPESLPVRIPAGKLSTDLAVEFALPPRAPPVLRLHGTIGLQDVQMTDTTGAPLLGWHRLDMSVQEAAPLARHLALSSVRLQGARLAARRDAAGAINLRIPPPSAAAEQSVATGPPLPAASTPASSVDATPPSWRVELERLEVADATVTWDDASLRPSTRLQVDDLNAELTRIQWPLERPIGVSARGRIGPVAQRTAVSGSFSLDGSATGRAVELKVSLSAVPLDALDGYVAQSLIPRLAGRLSTQARIDWSDGQHGAAPKLAVSLDTGTIETLTLRERAGPGLAAARELAALTRLDVTAARIDVPARALTIDHLAIDGPSFSLTRDKAGEFDVSRWFVPPATAPSTLVATSDAPRVAPWRVLVRDAALTGGRFQFVDAKPASVTPADPLRVAVADLRVAVQNLAWEGSRPTVPAQIEMSGRVGPPRALGENGSGAVGGGFDWRGVVGLEPLLLTGSLKIERMPVHLFMPYVGSDLALQLARAELGYAGNLSVRQLPTGLDVDAGADLLLGAVRIESREPAVPRGTLLSWNTLGLKSVRFSMKPGARPKVDIAQAVLDNFYSRLVITEEGRLNLSSVATSSPGGGDAAPIVPMAAANKRPPNELPIDIRLDGTVLKNGRIDFSDHFVRPNYSAALTELNGGLGALRSDSPEMAALSLRGKAAGTALLDIEGSVNPFARPVTLDLHAKATDLELAPLSPYAGKYAGYAIERGKLSLDVAYRLDADGRLEAKNQVVLNQLTFGAKIDSPVATQLPVRLAVALLKDRNGVIDLNLPISGSINDPQFSVGGIIARLLGNLLVKAITSPWSLLTGGSGAGDAGPDRGQVEFVPGTTRLAGAGLAAVDKVARALVDKPNLMLTVTGIADPTAEQDAYRSAALDDRLESARRKQTVASAAAASAPLPPLGSEARGRLIKALYQESDLPDKPRNVLGFAKDIPAAEMETRLKAIVDVSADAMRELALQRGVAVRDTLIARGLPSERLFLSAPQLRPDGPDSVPKAQLSLTLN